MIEINLLPFKRKRRAWNKGIPHSEETRKKISEKAKGRDKGKILSEEHREKIRLSNLGKHKGQKAWNKGMSVSEEQKRKQSIKMKEYYKTHENPFKGKHHDEKTKEHLKEKALKRTPTRRGAILSEKTRKKISIKLKQHYKVYGSSFKGKHRTEENRKKISQNLKEYYKIHDSPFKGRHHTEENRRKYSEARKGLHVGEKNGRWRGGISFEPYSPDWKNSLKETIRDRDNRVCQLCGLSEKENKKKLDVHHVDYNKKNCSSNNLVSLCRRCHVKTNSNREDFKKFFLEKLNLLINKI